MPSSSLRTVQALQLQIVNGFHSHGRTGGARRVPSAPWRSQSDWPPGSAGEFALKRASLGQQQVSRGPIADAICSSARAHACVHFQHGEPVARNRRRKSDCDCSHSPYHANDAPSIVFSREVLQDSVLASRLPHEITATGRATTLGELMRPPSSGATASRRSDGAAWGAPPSLLTVAKRVCHAPHHFVPVAALLLPKDAHRRIPGTSSAQSQPTPIRELSTSSQTGLPNAPARCGHRGIHANRRDQDAAITAAVSRRSPSSPPRLYPVETARRRAFSSSRPPSATQTSSHRESRPGCQGLQRHEPDSDHERASDCRPTPGPTFSLSRPPPQSVPTALSCSGAAAR